MSDEIAQLKKEVTALRQDAERAQALTAQNAVLRKDLNDLRKKYGHTVRDRDMLLQRFREHGLAVPPMAESEPSLDTFPE